MFPLIHSKALEKDPFKVLEQGSPKDPDYRPRSEQHVRHRHQGVQRHPQRHFTLGEKESRKQVNQSRLTVEATGHHHVLDARKAKGRVEGPFCKTKLKLFFSGKLGVMETVFGDPVNF